jgi:hypothetical protein
MPAPDIPFDEDVDAVGQVSRVLAGDPGWVPDLAAFCASAGITSLLHRGRAAAGRRRFRTSAAPGAPGAPRPGGAPRGCRAK